MSKKKESILPYAGSGAIVGATLGAGAGLKKLINTWNENKSRFNMHYAKSNKLLPLYTVVGALVGANAGVGLKYMRKEAADKDKRLSSGQIAGIAGVAGIGAAALFRKGLFKTPTQIASKGKLSWGLVPDAGKAGEGTRKLINPKTTGQKLSKELQYGDVKFINVSKEAKPPTKVEGALYLDTDIDKTIKVPKSDISYNVNKKLVDTLQDKLEYGKMKGKLVPKATTLTSVLKGKKVNTPEQLLDTLALSKSDLYYKPRTGEMSAGAGHFSRQDLVRMKQEPKYYSKRKKELHEMFKNRKEYIAQENLDLKKIPTGPDKGMPTTERRVHFAVHENKVKIITPKVPRWFHTSSIEAKPNVPLTAAIGAGVGAATGVSTDKKDHKLKRAIVGGAIGAAALGGGAKLLEHGVAIPHYYVRPDQKVLEKGLQEIWSKNPKLHSKSHSILGADVVIDKANKPHVIEINEQSGFFHQGITPEGGYAAHKLYKHITGRDTRLMSAAKGALVGGTTAVGLNTLNKKGRD